ncbi:MAG: glycosyltransferase family 4 protein [Vicinamibacterales bacterium]
MVDGIRQIVRDEQPDIVEVCDKHSLFYIAGLVRKGWFGRVGRPTLVGMSAERFDDNVTTFLAGDRVGTAFARWYMREIYTPMFDFHLANSVYTAQELLDVLPPHRQGVVHVAPPGLSNDAFTVPPGRDGRETILGLTGGGERTRLIAYVGRLSREKNLGLLVDMLERLIASETDNGPVHQLLVAGEGPERDRPLTARTRLGGRIHLLGNLPGGLAVRRLLSSVDLFVHANPKEPFGLAPLEAMACGIPVVVPDRGGVLSADHNTAWLAAPTPEAFATIVRTVLDRPDIARSRVTAALERAAEYHQSRVVPRYFSLLDALHRQRLSGAPAVLPSVGSPAVAERAVVTT